jgi:hypothetical protein
MPDGNEPRRRGVRVDRYVGLRRLRRRTAQRRRCHHRRRMTARQGADEPTTTADTACDSHREAAPLFCRQRRRKRADTPTPTKTNRATRSATAARLGDSGRDAATCGRQRRHRHGSASNRSRFLNVRRRHSRGMIEIALMSAKVEQQRTRDSLKCKIAVPLPTATRDARETTEARNHHSLHDYGKDAQRGANRPARLFAQVRLSAGLGACTTKALDNPRYRYTEQIE